MKKQPFFLIQLYQENAFARIIFDYWAQRIQHRGDCLLNVTSIQTNLGEEDVKSIFRHLDDAGFGKYVKRARTGQARFTWGTIHNGFPHDYSLISVARVAQGHNEELDGIYVNPNGIFDEPTTLEDKEINKFSNAKNSQLMSICVDYRGIPIRIDLPTDFNPENEMKDLCDLITIVIKNKRRK